ncbi:MAG: gamma-glutamylcyclotransferase family protein [Pseudomonadota bacterium]
MERIFIYGSLQPGGPNEHVLADVDDCWEAAVVTGKLVNSGWGASLGYPGLVLDECGQEVQGQILTSTELGAKWAELDQLEGDEYVRTELIALLRNGEKVCAYAYVLKEDGS